MERIFVGLRKLVLASFILVIFCPQTTNATFSGTNGKIVYLNSGQTELREVTETGSDTHLTSFDDILGSFSLNPAGDKLGFSYLQADLPAYIRDLSTGSTTPVSSYGGVTAFSYDGKLLAKAHKQIPNQEYLGIIDLSTGQEYSVNENSTTSVVWSPIERVLAFTDYTTQIQFYDWDSELLYSINTPCSSSVNVQDWSPDGTKVSLICVVNNHFENYILNLNSGTFSDFDPTNIYSNSIVTQIVWSPDGSKLALGFHNTSNIKIVTGEVSTAYTITIPTTRSWQSKIIWRATGNVNTSPVPENKQDVYRFWSSTKQKHFYTASIEERNSVIARWPHIWTYEGVAYSTVKICDMGDTVVYRFWSDRLQSHFYTANEAERDNVMAKWPDIWTYEGGAFCSPPGGYSNTRPVFRFWSNSMRGHFYTVDEGEKNYIMSHYPSNIWSYEGIAYWSRQ